MEKKIKKRGAGEKKFVLKFFLGDSKCFKPVLFYILFLIGKSTHRPFALVKIPLFLSKLKDLKESLWFVIVKQNYDICKFSEAQFSMC